MIGGDVHCHTKISLFFLLNELEKEDEDEDKTYPLCSLGAGILVVNNDLVFWSLGV